MALNIKDAQAHRLAKLLARETGESMTRAVIEALQQRLAHVRRRRKPQTVAEELLEIGKRCAATLPAPALDHADLLYDERGVPK